MNKRGRGNSPNIKNGIRAAILYIKTLHDNWSANRIREYLLINHSRFNLGKTDIPVTRSVYNVIERNQSTINDMQDIANSESFKKLESPWHMGTLGDYPLPPEALPYIVGVQEWREKTLDDFGRPRKPLTIRESQWVARLYPFLEKYLMSLDKKKIKTLGQAGYIAARYLSTWAETYAEYQIICRLSGTPFDTTQIDRDLRDGKIPLVSKFKGDKYSSILMFSQDNRISRITVKEDEK